MHGGGLLGTILHSESQGSWASEVTFCSCIWAAVSRMWCQRFSQQCFHVLRFLPPLWQAGVGGKLFLREVTLLIKNLNYQENVTIFGSGAVQPTQMVSCLFVSLPLESDSVSNVTECSGRSARAMETGWVLNHILSSSSTWALWWTCAWAAILCLKPSS